MGLNLKKITPQRLAPGTKGYAEALGTLSTVIGVIALPGAFILIAAAIILSPLLIPILISGELQKRAKTAWNDLASTEGS